MPKGPNGEWRPADANASAIMAAKIATKEIPEQYEPPKKKPDADGRTRTDS